MLFILKFIKIHELVQYFLGTQIYRHYDSISLSVLDNKEVESSLCTDGELTGEICLISTVVKSIY
jgi:hypothetical protein